LRTSTLPRFCPSFSTPSSLWVPTRMALDSNPQSGHNTSVPNRTAWLVSPRQDLSANPKGRSRGCRCE